MEEKKEIKIRVSTVIYLFIIVTLFVSLGVTYYFGFVVDKNEKLGDERITNIKDTVVSNVENEIETIENKVDNVINKDTENNKVTYTEKQVLDLVKNEDYIGNDGNYEDRLSSVRASLIKKENNKFIISAEYYIPIEITEKEYNEMVDSKKLVLEDNEYIYSDDEDFKYGVLEYKDYPTYEILKTNNGYAFRSLLAGAIIDKIEKEFEFIVDGNINIWDEYTKSEYSLKDKKAEKWLNNSFEERTCFITNDYNNDEFECLQIYISNL